MFHSTPPSLIQETVTETVLLLDPSSDKPGTNVSALTRTLTKRATIKNGDRHFKRRDGCMSRWYHLLDQVSTTPDLVCRPDHRCL